MSDLEASRTGLDRRLGEPGTTGARLAASLAGSPLARLAGVYVLLVLVFAVTADNFLTVDNFLNIGRATAVFGIAALGVTVALIAGALDVSFGAIMSLCGIVAAERLVAGDGFAIALLAAVAVGLGLGAVNGLISSLLRVDALIVTLGTLSVFGGYAYYRTTGQPTEAPGEAIATMGRGTWLEVPVSVWLLLGVALALALLLRFTTFGQRLYVVGDNARAAALSGLRVGRIRTAALAISGITAAVAGLLIAGNAGVANPGEGERYLLSAIAAVVIGGTALSGGVGTIAGTVVGIAILGTIDNGLNLLGVSTFWQDVVRGAIVVGALVLDRLRRSGGG